ncbi:DUF2809 domain-containing protein [Clostridium sp.]|uniref:ribosomal maturation YjgA family protein n=1 Tax=Clostridium sp. TaxID=1506 RepID=UPI00262C1650|nr:DUF2809 domain-containing protein [Clostridium sp.]
MKINKNYIIAFLILLFTEIFIALFVHDNFIRPYIGDVIVIPVLYCFIKGLFNFESRKLPIYLFIFGVFVELLQYIKIIEILGLEHIKFFRILIGTSFDFKDILCYLIGSLILIAWEYIYKFGSVLN